LISPIIKFLSEWGIFGLIPVAIYAPFFIFGAAFTFIWTATWAVYHAIIWTAAKIIVAVARGRDRNKWKKHTSHSICSKCGIKLGKGERAKNKRVEKFERPWYMCDICGRVHYTLSPDKFGIGHRLCKCERNLMRVNFKHGERAKYDMKCPICEETIQTKEAMPFSISLVGGPNSGKSAIVYGTMAKFADAGKDITVEYSRDTGSKVDEARRGLIGPTPMGWIEPAIMFFERPNYQRNKAVYFYDINGNEFTPESDKTHFEEQYLWNDGIIFVINPDSLRGLMNRIGATASKNTPESVFEAFYQKYSEYLDLHPKATSNVRIAVVINHAEDVRFKEHMTPFDLREIGNSSFVKEHSNRTRDLLVDADELNFIHIIESRFKNICYFAVDAVNDSVIAPTLWILSKRYPQICRYF
jgi:hypothetical protein